MSDVVRFATTTTTATRTSDGDGDASHRLAFIVSKDAGLLEEAASACVKKRGDVIVCGDFLSVGMRKIDRHPIEEAYRALVEEKSTKRKAGKDLKHSRSNCVWRRGRTRACGLIRCTTVGRRKKHAWRGRWQEDPYLFVVPGPSSIDDDDDDDDDNAWLWKIASEDSLRPYDPICATSSTACSP